jgi:CheY-like chemotaxis protein
MKKAHGKGTLIITTEKRENNIRMSFKDDGPGITKENLMHLFEPFFTTKAIGEGTGLGLSLSRSIVLEHGGTLNVESVSGHGATFVVEIPIIESQPFDVVISTLAAKEEPAAIKKGKILVVDDEPGVRALLEKVLTQSGHSVDTIGDASEALDKLGAGVIYDVILIDVRMPGMNGTEMYSRILEKMPEMKNKIIFITGDVMGADIKVFLTQNKLPYLAKPFDIELLKKQIDVIIKTDKPDNDSPNRSGVG